MRLIPKVALLLLASAAAACASHRKMETIRKTAIAPSLTLPQEQRMTPELSVTKAVSDSLSVTLPDGKEAIIMRAIRDNDGEMIASDVLDAAKVTARFRNIAERSGKVDIEFQIHVPEAMQDSRWQIRFRPKLLFLSDSIGLDPVLVTGKNYRKNQLRGYQQYQRFLDSIITDTTRFINLFQLEVFLERNLPSVFAFKNDTSFVSDERFASAYGVTQKDAVEHYTNWLRVKRNRHKYEISDKMYRKYVKSPMISEGIRLDTVIRDINGDFIYNYIQTINTRPRLKKVDVVLDGDVFEQEKKLYTIPRGAPLSFYISSLSYFVDDRQRFITKVIERKVSEFDSYRIDFEQGRSEILPLMSDNANEISRIKGRLTQLLKNREYELDSIIVGASSSPEGRLNYNAMLTQRRSEAVSDYFSKFIHHCRDSLVRQDGLFYNLDQSYGEGINRPDNIKFIPRGRPENWEKLDELIKEDPHVSNSDYHTYRELSYIEDVDLREAELKKTPFYGHLLNNVYPKLRTVRFDFYMHKKNMMKDTIHTSVLDTTYMKGVEALKERDYKEAVTLLRPYRDYNTALALCSMDYNASAKSILLNQARTAKVEYLLSILYSREGDEQSAVQSYINACAQDQSLVHRGNLDPEIASLIKKYDLNNDKEETILRQ